MVLYNKNNQSWQHKSHITNSKITKKAIISLINKKLVDWQSCKTVIKSV